MISENMKRSCYLDNLKLFLTLLVVFHHAGQAHDPSSYWPYHFEDPSMMMPWIWHFFSTNASFFMGLFFLVAGYFTPNSYDRQKAGIFVKKKLLRLGIPCILMTGILTLLVGHMEIGHMWFVENLLLFSLLYAAYRLVFPREVSYRQQGPRIVWLLSIALVMGVIAQIVRQYSPQDNWINIGRILYFEPARYPQYVIMFVLGLFACRFDFFDRMDRNTGLACLIMGGLLAVCNYLRADGPWNAFVESLFGFYESLMSVSISFGLIWLFRECFNRTDAFLSWSAAQTYWVYVVHLPLMIVLQFMTDSLTMPRMAKFLFIGLVTTVFSFLIAWGINSILKLLKPKKSL